MKLIDKIDQGQAVHWRCHCGHEWDAALEKGTAIVECPACHEKWDLSAIIKEQRAEAVQ